MFLVWPAVEFISFFLAWKNDLHVDRKFGALFFIRMFRNFADTTTVGFQRLHSPERQPPPVLPASGRTPVVGCRVLVAADVLTCTYCGAGGPGECDHLRLLFMAAFRRTRQGVPGGGELGDTRPGGPECPGPSGVAGGVSVMRKREGSPSPSPMAW